MLKTGLQTFTLLVGLTVVLTVAAENTGVYRVIVHTSDVALAGTDSNVYIRLTGVNGQSGNLTLDAEHSVHNDDGYLESGSITEFEFDNVTHLGRVLSIDIWHDDSGLFAGWKLEKITVQDTDRDVDYTFSCNCWLASDEGHGNLTRTLISGGLEPTDFEIIVKTSDISSAGTDAHVFIQLIGEDYTSATLNLDADHLIEPVGGHLLFEQGSTDHFRFDNVPEVGALQSVKIWHDDTGWASGWHLDAIEVIDLRAAQQYEGTCECWLDDDQLEQIIPVTVKPTE